MNQTIATLAALLIAVTWSTEAETQVTLQEQGADPRVVEMTDACMAVSPRLEIRQFSGEFEKWGTDRVIDEAQTVYLRWSPPAGESAHWELWLGDPDSQASPLATGAALEAGQKGIFTVDLRNHLPATPPPEPQLYSIRAIPTTCYPSTAVAVTYALNDAPMTQFTSLGLDPNMLNPQRLFIDLHRLQIVEADEEDDEEPYMVNIVILFDGTTIDLENIDDSEVRVICSQGTHGNLHHGGDVGSGDSLYPGPNVGDFTFMVEPLNANLATDGFDIDGDGDGDVKVDAAILTQGTRIALFTMAIEEDDTTADTANKVKSAMCKEIKRRLDLVLRCGVTDQVLKEVALGIRDPDELVPEEWPPPCEQLTACPGLQGVLNCDGPSESFENALEAFAEDVALGEELNNIAWPLPEAALVGLLIASDHDDVIGHEVLTFTFEQLRTANKPVPIEVELKSYVKGWNEAAGQWVVYRLEGSVGRCRNVNEERCVPYYAPFWYDGKLHDPYD